MRSRHLPQGKPCSSCKPGKAIKSSRQKRGGTSAKPGGMTWALSSAGMRTCHRPQGRLAQCTAPRRRGSAGKLGARCGHTTHTRPSPASRRSHSTAQQRTSTQFVDLLQQEHHSLVCYSSRAYAACSQLLCWEAGSQANLQGPRWAWQRWRPQADRARATPTSSGGSARTGRACVCPCTALPSPPSSHKLYSLTNGVTLQAYAAAWLGHQ